MTSKRGEGCERRGQTDRGGWMPLAGKDPHTGGGGGVERE